VLGTSAFQDLVRIQTGQLDALTLVPGRALLATVVEERLTVSGTGSQGGNQTGGRSARAWNWFKDQAPAIQTLLAIAALFVAILAIGAPTVAIINGTNGPRTTTTSTGPGSSTSPPAALSPTAYLDSLPVSPGSESDVQPMTGLATVGGRNFTDSVYFNSINGFNPVSVTYSLDRHYRLFQTSFGLQNDPRETVVFEVFVDGRRVLDQEVTS
jgi:hypothetical protein